MVRHGEVRCAHDYVSYVSMSTLQTGLADSDKHGRSTGVKFYGDAMLTCVVCNEEGLHELLYLSEHLRASRCGNCGHAGIYSSHLRADYAADLAGRFVMLPRKLAIEALSHPGRPLRWPIKALHKPFKLLQEIGQVETFEHDREHVR